MRPKTIVYFERIIFGTLLLAVVQTYLTWDQVIARAATLDRNTAVPFILTVAIFSFVLVGTLTLLVSRRRSKIAMWVSIALFAIGLYGLYDFLVESISRGQLGSDIVPLSTNAIYGIAQFVAFALLFTPSARRWMNREDKKLGEVFH